VDAGRQLDPVAARNLNCARLFQARRGTSGGWCAIGDECEERGVARDVGAKLHPSGDLMKDIDGDAVGFHLLGVLPDAAGDAMRPRILPARKIVMKEGSNGQDEPVQHNERNSQSEGAPQTVAAGHWNDYGTIRRMIPLRDVIPSRTFPFINIAIIVINTAAFFFELSVSNAGFQPFLRTFALVPATFAWSALLTSMFIHGGWLHFLGNMLYLWIFGDNVEDRLGHARYLVFYLACGTAAGIAHVYMNPSSMIPTLGASGAIAGVMGAYFVLYPHSRILTLVPLFIFYMRVIEVPAILFLGIWFIIQFLSGAVSAGGEAGGVAVWAHVAGFLVGVVWVLIFRARRTTWE
jgi:membrane associated rhomboid family serine protease